MVNRDIIDAIPPEADRLLQIWGWYKCQEGGVVALGYPKRSALLSSGGASSNTEELAEREDRRCGAIADTILDDMAANGLFQQVGAIYNKYLCDAFRFSRPIEGALVDGCVTFLIAARKKGIAL